jgi:hypothetical protein
MKIPCLIALTVLMISLDLCGQTATEKPKDPDYVNQFFMLDKGGNLSPLDRESARASTKVHGLGYGGAETVYVIPNDHSSVRVPRNEVPRFIVKLEKHDVDPASVVQFYSVRVTKKERELPIVKAHLFGGAKNKMQDNAIAFDVRKYTDASVMIVPRQPLSPGEYLLTVYPEQNNGTVYCFGVSQ